MMPSGSDLSAIGFPNGAALKFREVRDLSSPNPSESGWFKITVKVGPRFYGGSNGS